MRKINIKPGTIDFGSLIGAAISVFLFAIGAIPFPEFIRSTAFLPVFGIATLVGLFLGHRFIRLEANAFHGGQ